MLNRIRAFALIASAALLFVLLVVFLGEAAKVAELADSYLDGSRRYVLWSLVGMLALFLLVPWVLFWRLRAPLLPPKEDEGPKFEAHLGALRARLAKNPLLIGQALRDREEIEQGLSLLGEAADRLTREAAQTVFLVTAISPNGRFDLLTVLSVQSRLVWRIAHTYSQRPTVRDMVTLYANVAGSAFVAGELDELDLSEQVQPLVASSMSALPVGIPGITGIASILANAISSGTANAFLTLRVGIITRRYCGALVRPERGLLRRSAILEAARLLTSVAGSCATRVSRAVAGSVARTATAGVSRAGTFVRDASVSGASQVGGFARETGASVAARVRRKGGEIVEEPETDEPGGVEGMDPEADQVAQGRRKFGFRRMQKKPGPPEPKPG